MSKFRTYTKQCNLLGSVVVAQATLDNAAKQPRSIANGDAGAVVAAPAAQARTQSIAARQSTNIRPVCRGDRLLEDLYAKLAHIDRLQYPRSHHQVKFHDCFTRASLRIIYGDDYERVEKFLKEEFDVNEFRTEVMIVTPRRFGKTFSVAQYCAAFATSIMGKEVAIFSTGRRASKKILDLVLRFLRPLMRPTQKIVLHNVEEVHILDEATGLLNKVCSYPSKVQVRNVCFIVTVHTSATVTKSPSASKTQAGALYVSDRPSFACLLVVVSCLHTHVHRAGWCATVCRDQSAENKMPFPSIWCTANATSSGAGNRWHGAKDSRFH